MTAEEAAAEVQVLADKLSEAIERCTEKFDCMVHVTIPINPVRNTNFIDFKTKGGVNCRVFKEL